MKIKLTAPGVFVTVDRMRTFLPLVLTTLALSTLAACSGDNFTQATAPVGGSGGAAGTAGGGAPAAGSAGAAPVAGSSGGPQAGASGAAQAGTGGAGGAGGANAGSGGGPGGEGGSAAGSAGSNTGGGQQGGSAGQGGNGGASAGAGGGGGGGGCATLYVSASASDAPGNDGCSPNTPLRSLGKAFAAAKANTAVGEIRVCAGSYSESNLELEVSVAVRGGYDCATWQVPPGDPDALTTVIAFTSGTGLRLVDGLSAKTEIERLHFENHNTSDARVTGIFVGKNAVKIRRVRVSNPDDAAQAKGSDYASAALFVGEDAKADIRESRFEGGPGLSDVGVGSVGVWLAGSTPDLVFKDNEAFGGRGDTDSGVFPASAGIVVIPRRDVTTLERLAHVEGGPGHSTRKPPSLEPELASAGMVIRPPTGAGNKATVSIVDASVAGGTSRADDKTGALIGGQTRGIDASGKNLTVALVRTRVYGGDHAGTAPSKAPNFVTKTEGVRMIDGQITATSTLIHAGGLEGGTFYPRAVTIEGLEKGAAFRGRYITLLPGKLAPVAEGDGAGLAGGNAVGALIKADEGLFQLEDSLVVATARKTIGAFAQEFPCGGSFTVSLTRTRYVHPESAPAAPVDDTAVFLGGAEPCTGVRSLPLSDTTVGTGSIKINDARHVGDAGGNAPTATTLAGCGSSTQCFATLFPEAAGGGTRAQVLDRTRQPFTPACGVGAGIGGTALVGEDKPLDLMGEPRTSLDKTLGALVPRGCP